MALPRMPKRQDAALPLVPFFPELGSGEGASLALFPQTVALDIIRLDFVGPIPEDQRPASPVFRGGRRKGSARCSPLRPLNHDAMVTMLAPGTC
jgi:hypothetical protein